jgi:hypothetical protein
MRQRTGISTAAAELPLARRSWPRVSAPLRRWRPHIRIVSSAPSLISYLGLMLFAGLSSSTATQRRTFKSFRRNTHKMKRPRFDIGCKDTHPSHIAVRGSCIRRSVHVRIRQRTS